VDYDGQIVRTLCNPNYFMGFYWLSDVRARQNLNVFNLSFGFFVSCIFIGVPRLYHFYYKDLRGREWPRLVNLCGKNGRITRTPKIQEIIRCKIRKLNMKKTP